MRRWDDIIDSIDRNLSKRQETVKDRESLHAAVYGVTKRQTKQWLKNNSKTLIMYKLSNKPLPLYSFTA